MVSARPDRPILSDVILAMNEAMRHRGPDDSGLWNGGHAALAMRRLSIIDLFRGHQPMLNDDESVVLVFNGEIYNHKSLRTDLEQQGHAFKTLSDTEVILRAYEEYGDGCLKHLNGMFAFAIYDTRSDRLLLARDRLGIKPLFFTLQNGCLAFASELDALARSGLFPGGLNPAALDAYFAYLYVPAPDTIYQGVHKLRPGEKLIYQGGQITKDFYWRLSYEPKASWTLDSAAERFAELLSEAVSLQSTSDVPLGALLSGGVDSSLVVGVLSRLAATPLKTFTVGFDAAHFCELEYAQLAAIEFGTNHTETIIQPDTVEMAADLTKHFGEPFADSSAIPTWIVSNLARRDVTVALSGDGGDELFAGYTWAHMAHRVAAYRRAPAPLRRLMGAALHLLPSSPRTARLRRFHDDAFLDEAAAFRRRHLCFGDAARAGLYTPDWARAVAENASDRYAEHVDSTAGLSYGDHMLAHDTAMYLPDDILTKVDRMSMGQFPGGAGPAPGPSDRGVCRHGAVPSEIPQRHLQASGEAGGPDPPSPFSPGPAKARFRHSDPSMVPARPPRSFRRHRAGSRCPNHRIPQSGAHPGDPRGPYPRKRSIMVTASGPCSCLSIGFATQNRCPESPSDRHRRAAVAHHCSPLAGFIRQLKAALCMEPFRVSSVGMNESPVNNQRKGPVAGSQPAIVEGKIVTLNAREAAERHYGDLYRFAYRMIQAREAAEDMVQEAFLRLARTGPSLEDEPLRRWLFVVVRHLCISHLRREIVRRGLDPPPDHPAQDPGPSVAAETEERSSWIARTVAELPVDQREAIVLREYQQMSYAEIAAIVDCSLGTVRSRLARARATLRLALAAQLEDYR